MEDMFLDLFDFWKKPSIIETLVDILLCTVPIWLAVMTGLVIGWSWRPRWTGLVFLGFRSKFRFVWTAPPGFGSRRLWLAVTAISVCRTVWANFRRKEIDGLSTVDSRPAANSEGNSGSASSCSPMIKTAEEQQDLVTEKDLDHLLFLLEGKVGEMEWQIMMDRSTPNMAYQAWHHEPENGPTVYRNRTVFEDATPEVVRDFFWDDEFRLKWDPMLAYFKILEECPHTGMMIVHWIRKFPFFCSDREYIIGRRIWEDGETYYCVTKGVPYPGLQKRDKPRRVDTYFSSWIVKPVQSRKGDGQLSSCEVTLLHYEDMGIPKDVTKLGLRHGMWGGVKKLHSGMRAYQNARKSETSLSRSALMARITAKISIDNSRDSFPTFSGNEEKGQAMDSIEGNKRDHGVDWKWVVLGGTVALVCLRTGIIGKTLLLGAGQRIARR